METSIPVTTFDHHLKPKNNNNDDDAKRKERRGLGDLKGGEREREYFLQI